MHLLLNTQHNSYIDGDVNMLNNPDTLYLLKSVFQKKEIRSSTITQQNTKTRLLNKPHSVLCGNMYY